MSTRQPEIRYRQLMARKREEESLRDLAQRHGVKPGTFYKWHHRFKSSQQELVVTSEIPELVSVEVAGNGRSLDLASLIAPGFEVALRSGHVVRVPAKFDPTSFALLVSVLEQE